MKDREKEERRLNAAIVPDPKATISPVKCYNCDLDFDRSSIMKGPNQTQMRRTVKKMITQTLQQKFKYRTATSSVTSGSKSKRRKSHYYCKQPDMMKEAKKRERRDLDYQWRQNLKALPDELANLYIKEAQGYVEKEKPYVNEKPCV